MILYTMMPQELIFQTDENEFGKQMEVVYEGIPLMVERTDDHGFRVVKILSSDPEHYLDSRCVPGSKISIP